MHHHRCNYNRRTPAPGSLQARHRIRVRHGIQHHIPKQHEPEKEIEAELSKVDFSLSPFNAQSVISKINRNEDVVADSMFADVFTMAQKISGETGGAFDITVAPLVNAWGFGFKHDTEPTPQAIDSLRQLIGYEKVTLDNGKVKKADKRIMLDCSAIAKGYACDVVPAICGAKALTTSWWR